VTTYVLALVGLAAVVVGCALLPPRVVIALFAACFAVAGCMALHDGAILASSLLFFEAAIVTVLAASSSVDPVRVSREDRTT
jgi:membrane associated rhomboid family serine protease